LRFSAREFQAARPRVWQVPARGFVRGDALGEFLNLGHTAFDDGDSAHEEGLVVASARGNLEPLLELATQCLQEHDLSLGDFTRRVPKTELERCQ